MIQKYIFDFGNVFINLDKESTARELVKFGLTDFTQEMLRKNHQYEKGLISTTDFIRYYKNLLPKSSDQELQMAWNKILLDFPLYRLEFIENFSKTNDCILLSNINEMHLDFIIKQLGTDFYQRFIQCFDKIYYTHEIHLRKPDKEIYDFVLNDLQVKPEHCFFVDDTLENIQTAQKVGIHCWHIQPEKEDIVHLEQQLQSMKI